MRKGALASIVVLLSCRGRPSPDAIATKTVALPTVLTIAAGAACLPGQRDIRQWVEPAIDAAERRFRSWGLHDIRKVDARRRAVLDELERPRREPLIVLFAGHGALREPRAKTSAWVSQCSETGPRCVSMACTGTPLSFDDMVHAVSPSVPWALFLLDACTSAHVDVRLARTRVSVASISPFAVDGDLSLLTRGIAALDDAKLDGDCDGSVTDIEFFRALDLDLPEGGERGAFLANPKLRRQVPGPLPLFALPAQKGCLPHDVPNYRGVERLDARVYVTHEALRPGEPLLWDGRAIPASSLQLVPCENDVGQCFREYEP